MNKSIGYIVGVLGIASLALSYDQIRKVVGITLPSSLTTTILTIIGIVLVVLSILLLAKGSSSSKQPVEVPIYKGKNVVGFRRMDK